MECKKKIAFVSGVSDGIGAAFTKILLQNGWEVIGISRNEQKLNSFKKSINSMPNVFKSYKCDVQNIEKLKKIEN
jgi:short-subunit dehydrogenase